MTGLEYRAWKHGPVPFDDSHFTKRELRLMQELAERHRDDMTPLLIGLTHEERGPWDKIWDGGRGNEARIPYALAVPDDHPNRDAVLKAASEYDAIIEADSLRHRDEPRPLVVDACSQGISTATTGSIEKGTQPFRPAGATKDFERRRILNKYEVATRHQQVTRRCAAPSGAPVASPARGHEQPVRKRGRNPLPTHG